MKQKIPLSFKIVIIITIASISFYIWLGVIHSGQSNDPLWEDYTETYTSMADAEAALGEDLLLNRLVDPSDDPYRGWWQYIEEQYGADMLAKLEKERASSPFEEVILYHKIGDSPKNPQSWKEITACVNYSGLVSGSPKDGPQYPEVNLTIYFEPQNLEKDWRGKVQYGVSRYNDIEIFNREYTYLDGGYGLAARFELDGRYYYLSTKSPNDSWFGMKTLKRLLDWDELYIPAGAYLD